jgi:hypothetical protein
MSRYLPILLAVCLAVTGFAGVASGGVQRHYSHAYYSAVDRCGGKDAVGRNVRREGDTLSNGKHVTEAKYKALTATLDSQCRPQPKPQPVASSTAAQSVQSASTGAAGLPACASESGTNYSTGPDNTNPSSATGRYQILQSTHADLCSDLGWSPGDQDKCAARIYKAQGSGAWVNCG